MSFADLARAVGCHRSVITHIMSDYAQSPLVPEIHKVFGWEDPIPTLSSEETELLAIYEDLEEIDRARLLERCRAMRDEARRRNR